jgi:GT2 family glycosyltransferase
MRRRVSPAVPGANRAGKLGRAGPGTQLTLSLQKIVTWGGSLQAFPAGVHRCDPIASYSEPFETYWANGACMMIRAQTVREVGLFDRNMRFICSDSDFSFTARARGWKVFVVPQALCQHSLGASGASSNPAIDLVKVRDAQYFAEKWLTGGVYRRLALEGPELTRTGVRQVVRSCEHEARALERRLGQREASPADAYPSWTARMQVPPGAA